MLYLLGGTSIVVLLIVVYVLSYRSGISASINDSKTTYDATLDYITPVNEFIDRIITTEIHRLKSSYDRPENGQVFFSDLVNDRTKYHALLIKVSLLVTSYMSKNLKNAFYRLYNRRAVQSMDPKDRVSNSYGEDFLLSEYTIQRCIIYINDKVTTSIIKLESFKKELGRKTGGKMDAMGISEIRKLVENDTVLELEKEMQERYNFISNLNPKNQNTK